jgi:hypothetical protein
VADFVDHVDHARCRGVVTANTGNQLQTKTWPELAKWHGMALNNHWFQWTAQSYYFSAYPEDARRTTSAMRSPCRRKQRGVRRPAQRDVRRLHDLRRGERHRAQDLGSGRRRHDGRRAVLLLLRQPDAEAITKYRPDAVFIDAGQGSGVIDRLRELRYRVTEVWFGGSERAGDFADNRTGMWAAMRDWIPGGCIDADQELYDDLIGPETRYTGKQGDTLKLESKDDMQRRGLASPDNGDALALTFYAKVARSDRPGARGRARVAMAVGADSDAYGE